MAVSSSPSSIRNSLKGIASPEGSPSCGRLYYQRTHPPICDRWLSNLKEHRLTLENSKHRNSDRRGRCPTCVSTNPAEAGAPNQRTAGHSKEEHHRSLALDEATSLPTSGRMASPARGELRGLQEQSSEMQSAIETVRASIRFAERAAANVNQTRDLLRGKSSTENGSQVSSNQDRAIKEIEERFATLTQLLQRRKAVLINAVKEAVSRKVAMLDEQQQELADFLLACHSAIGAAPVDQEAHCNRLLALGSTKLYPQAVVDSSISVSFDREIDVAILTHGHPVYKGSVPQALTCASASPDELERDQQAARMTNQQWQQRARLDCSGYDDIEPTFDLFNDLTTDLIAGPLDCSLSQAAGSGHANTLLRTIDRLGSEELGSLGEISGWTPMHSAAEGGHVRIIELLARLGCRGLDASTGNGMYPLLIAARNGHADAVEALVRLGSQALDKSMAGITAMHLAAENGWSQVIERLVQLGSTALDACQNYNCKTPLLAAAECGHADAIDTLVRMGSRALDAPNKNGWTPMHKAARKQHVPVIEALVRLGSQAIDTPNRLGKTPLHLAATEGRFESIETLVQLGSKAVDTPDSHGHTPLYFAGKGRSRLRTEQQRAVCIQTLKALGASTDVNISGWTRKMVAILDAPVTDEEAASIKNKVSRAWE